jgi:hypothetical protein
VPSLDTLLAALLDPHPELVAATRPTPAQVLEAVDYLGWVPAVPFLVPAVPARAEPGGL